MPGIFHAFTDPVPDDPTVTGVRPSHWNSAHTDSSGNALTIRETLAANADYYVTATGSDSNPGTLAQPWLTLQHAMDFIAANIDIAGFTVTINVGTGTFAGIGI